jgi:hypothetical protein
VIKEKYLFYKKEHSMNLRRWLLGVGFLLLSCCRLAGTEFLVSNGQAITAYGDKGAFLITSLRELLYWNDTQQKWLRLMTLIPTGIRQIDCLGDGTKLMGTDGDGTLWGWNGVPTPGGLWTENRPGKKYDWVILDPVSDERRGLIQGLETVWESWDKPVGGDWNSYIPVGPESASRMETLILVDTKSPEFHRWQRGDFGYRVALNQSGQTTPFKIFAYTEDPDRALDRVVNPPSPTPWLDSPADTVKDPDLVLAKQISYDEQEKNLWCVDENGWPWHWNDEFQGWELRRTRGEAPYGPPVEVEDKYGEIRKLLCAQDDYYVRTTYIEGDYKPLVIIFKDSQIIHFILGEMSKSDIHDIQICIFEARKPQHNFDNILLLPKERPQKLVRLPKSAGSVGGVGEVKLDDRIRENHYLERLLIANGVIASQRDIGVYPAEHRLVRR